MRLARGILGVYCEILSNQPKLNIACQFLSALSCCDYLYKTPQGTVFIMQCSPRVESNTSRGTWLCIESMSIQSECVNNSSAKQKLQRPIVGRNLKDNIPVDPGSSSVTKREHLSLDSLRSPAFSGPHHPAVQGQRPQQQRLACTTHPYRTWYWRPLPSASTLLVVAVTCMRLHVLAPTSDNS